MRRIYGARRQRRPHISRTFVGYKQKIERKQLPLYKNREIRLRIDKKCEKSIELLHIGVYNRYNT